MIERQIFYAAIAMAAVVLSCTREAELQDALSVCGNMEVRAVWAQDGDSRTQLAENGEDILWSPGEEINLFYGSRYSGKFASTNTEPQSIISFVGNLTIATGTMEKGSESSVYWAVYPYDADNFCDGESVTLTLSQEQTGKAGTFADKFFPAVACGSTPDLAFYNVCGLARFSVVTAGVQRIVFRSNDGSTMAGTVRVDFGSDWKPQVLEVSDAKDSVVVNAPEGGFVPGENYFAAMLPQTHAQGLTVTLYTATKRAVKAINKSITVRRSAFGTLDNVDEGITDWTDYKPEAEGGGTRSGLYLGIIGFNDQLYQMPIERLNAASYSRFTEFIDGLTTRKATLLYYSVGESLEALSRARYPENLFNVSLLTFTDGLDQGSSMMIEDYPGDDEYLQILNDKMTNTVVQSVPLTAYSVGLRGSDVSDVTKFRNNLKKLATPESNAFEVSDMSTVNSRFQAIADQLSQTLTSYQYNLSLTIPGQANGTRMRFTLDNVSSATASSLYIEGVFNLSSKSLTEVSYHGLTAENGDTVKGEVDGVYVRFPFTGVVIGDGKSDALNKTYIRHWTYVASSGSWQRNSEFDAENDASVEVTTNKKSAVVLLNLDCSSSLAGDFSTLKTHAKSFVQRLYEASIDPSEVTGVTLKRTSIKIIEGNSATLMATVTPSTAVDKSVTWTSSDPSVATVSAEGMVEAISAGTCTIEVTTNDGSFTASCTVTVVDPTDIEAVDLGLSVKWASFNLGAFAPEEYGDYFAWGETEPKEDYSWSTYKWCMNGSYSQLTKYCYNSSYGYNGFTDNKYTLDPEDDAAAVNWGGSWRMPTKAEQDELRSECTWTWTTLNGVKGMKVTSNKEGYTNKWIFLPAAGDRGGTSLFNAGSYGFSWSSSLHTYYPFYAYNVYFNSDIVDWGNYYGRCGGQSVRPVSEY